MAEPAAPLTLDGKPPEFLSSRRGGRPPGTPGGGTSLGSLLRNARGRNNPAALVQAARKHTFAAISTLAALMNDKEQPGPVRIKAAEILIDRGYGKAPMAVLISTEDDKTAGGRELTILEKVAAIRAAAVGDEATMDLEASAAIEVEDDEDVIG